jgi:carboxyl-terminal processing protease
MLVRRARAFIIICLCIAAIPVLADTTTEADLYEQIHQNVGLFGDIYREVSLRYVDTINPDEFMRAGIEGMLSTLDPYTVFIPEEDTEDLDVITFGKYGGVGIEIGVRGNEKVLTVISAMDDSPAQRVGIRTGDRIIAVQDELTTNMTTRDASRLLRGDSGTQVKLTIERSGSPEPIEFMITRQTIDVKDVPYSGFVEPGVGYLKLAHFSTRAPQEVETALEDLKAGGMTSLILDLRGNPGGLLSAAVGVLQKFLNKGEEVVSTKGRTADANRSFRLASDPIVGDIPMVVLVDGGSASASEIVAGAIQDLDRGVLVGDTSFGKGLVQSVIAFETGEALKMTTAKYFTPSGRLIQKIDYFRDDQDVVVEQPAEVPDEVFATRNGRPVEGGGGIIPDIEIPTPQPGELGVELWRQGVFFDFINDYRIEHPNLTDASIPESALDEFHQWLKNRDFHYEVDGQSEITALRGIISEFAVKDSADSSFDDSTEVDFTHLEGILEQVRERDFSSEHDFIQKSLESELANSLWGSRGRIEASFVHDPQIKKATELLTNQPDYAKLLAVKDSTDVPSGDQ